METRQLTLDEAVPVNETDYQKLKQASVTAPQIEQVSVVRDPSKRICHGVPMRKVNLGSGRFAYRCDECQTLIVREK